MQLHLMRGLAGTLAASALVGFCGTVAQAAPTRIERLSKSEQKWATPMITLWNDVNLNLHVVLAEEAAKNALIAGSGKNNTLLTKTLIVFANCSAEVKNAGKPPSTRIVPFADAMTGMCGHIVSGAHAVAKAIGAVGRGNGKLAASLLTQGTAEFKKGSTLLGTAQKQLLLIGGKNVFTA
jgi:hypothetical protein